MQGLPSVRDVAFSVSPAHSHVTSHLHLICPIVSKKTISNIAVPLRLCEAMAAEVVGVCVLTGILDVVLGKHQFESNQSMYRCGEQVPLRSEVFVLRKVQCKNVLQRCVCEQHVASVVDEDCSEVRRGVRTKLGRTFPQLVFSVAVPEYTFWDMLPSPVLIDCQYTRPSCTTDEWCEKKKTLDCLFRGNLSTVWRMRLSPAVDVICPLVVVVSVRPSAARLSTAQGLDGDLWVMLWHLLPGPAVGGQAYRIPPISTAKWKEKRALFDEKTGRVGLNAESSARAKFTRGYVVKQFWLSSSILTMQSKQWPSSLMPSQ